MALTHIAGDQPHDLVRRVWLINETFHQIYVLLDDGQQRAKHARPEGALVLNALRTSPSRRTWRSADGPLIADGLDNHRPTTFDAHPTTSPSSAARAPAGAVQRAARRRRRTRGRISRSYCWWMRQCVRIYRRSEKVSSVPGRLLLVDLIVNDDAVWMTDLKPLRFVNWISPASALHLDGAARAPRRLSSRSHLLGGRGRQPLCGDNHSWPDAQVRAQARGGSKLLIGRRGRRDDATRSRRSRAVDARRGRHECHAGANRPPGGGGAVGGRRARQERRPRCRSGRRRRRHGGVEQGLRCRQCRDRRAGHARHAVPDRLGHQDVHGRGPAHGGRPGRRGARPSGEHTCPGSRPASARRRSRSCCRIPAD